jgi:hypothetical protein
MVDAGLSSNAAVHHRQQRCRHLRQTDPAKHGRRREAHQVASHAAAEGHQHV